MRHHLIGTAATSCRQFTVTFCHASQPGVTLLDKGFAIESKACDFRNFDLKQIFFYYYYIILERDQISLRLLILILSLIKIVKLNKNKTLRKTYLKFGAEASLRAKQAKFVTP